MVSLNKILGNLLFKKYAYRMFSTTSKLQSRVCVVGAAGGTGRPLSMLLKMNPKVTTLNLYDAVSTAAIAADVSHIDTLSIVKSFTGKQTLDESLACVNILVVAGGEPEGEDYPTDAELLDANAEFMTEVMTSAAKNCPRAMIVLLTSPINSMVPFAAEILKQYKAYDPKRLFGVTHLNIMRAKSIIADTIIRNPLKIKLQVIGGQSCETILPIISQCMPPLNIDKDDKQLLYDRIRKRNAEVILAKENQCGSQLAAALGANILCNALFEAMTNRKGILATAYVSSTAVPNVPFFSSEFELDANGVGRIRRLPMLSCYEQELLKDVESRLKEDIKLGKNSAKEMACEDSKPKGECQ